MVDLVRQAFGGSIDLDPCAPPDPEHHIARRNLVGPTGSAFCGLAAEWNGRAFVNPPFGDLSEWAAKCRREHEARHAEIVLLLPSRTDTLYWHDNVSTARAICLWKGRMKFIGAKDGAPFPTALVYWGPHPWAFHAVFKPKGMVVIP